MFYPLSLLGMMSAMLNDFFKLTRMVFRILWRRPNACNAKLTAAALLLGIRTIHFPPRMTTAYFNTPAVQLNEIKRLFNFLFRMYRSAHFLLPA
ncbi:hypothetical protein XK86_00555 [Hafnia alvei]|nr:hypothetical protein XK86_00555 [Hafnia alvei]